MAPPGFQGAPVPWRYTCGDGLLRDQEGKVICDLWSVSEFSAYRDAAHGTLMSAAPELLQALQDLLFLAGKDNALKNTRELKAAEAAVKKALSWGR